VTKTEDEHHSDVQQKTYTALIPATGIVQELMCGVNDDKGS
jgi:hypothetical protein